MSASSTASERTAIVRVLWERGRARWPQIALSVEELEAHLVARLGDALTHDAERLHADDLYLACACVAGKPGAVEAFKAAHEAALAVDAGGVARGGDAGREIVQELLVRLVVGDGESGPKLAEYSGRGPLRAWLRMATVRRAFNVKRGEKRQASMEARLASEVVSASDDPEISIIRERYQPELRAAIRDAIANLPAPERALLSLCYGEGLNLGAIATMQRVSKPTISRRLAEAREAVLSRASALLRERLRLGAAELESLLGLLAGDLDMSLSGLLRPKGSTA